MVIRVIMRELLPEKVSLHLLLGVRGKTTGQREFEGGQIVGLLYDRWRHHRSPPPQFRHRTGGKGIIPQSPALVVLAATAHKSFGLFSFDIH
ncbi:hypothetical protein TNCV_766621 [Trichonephila clavipes]|nr:hypothetical protein TNCV_766621 [Trichonephila clavipes]